MSSGLRLLAPLGALVLAFLGVRIRMQWARPILLLAAGGIGMAAVLALVGAPHVAEAASELAYYVLAGATLGVVLRWSGRRHPDSRSGAAPVPPDGD